MDYFVNTVFFISGTILFVGYIFASTILVGQMVNNNPKVDGEMREFEEFYKRRI